MNFTPVIRRFKNRASIYQDNVQNKLHFGKTKCEQKLLVFVTATQQAQDVVKVLCQTVLQGNLGLEPLASKDYTVRPASLHRHPEDEDDDEKHGKKSRNLEISTFLTRNRKIGQKYRNSTVLGLRMLQSSKGDPYHRIQNMTKRTWKLLSVVVTLWHLTCRVS